MKRNLVIWNKYYKYIRLPDKSLVPAKVVKGGVLYKQQEETLFLPAVDVVPLVATPNKTLLGLGDTFLDEEGNPCLVDWSKTTKGLLSVFSQGKETPVRTYQGGVEDLSFDDYGNHLHLRYDKPRSYVMGSTNGLVGILGIGEEPIVFRQGEGIMDALWVMNAVLQDVANQGGVDCIYLTVPNDFLRAILYGNLLKNRLEAGNLVFNETNYAAYEGTFRNYVNTISKLQETTKLHIVVGYEHRLNAHLAKQY